MLPPALEKALADASYRREDAVAVAAALQALGVDVPAAFREFYETFRGPFGSTTTGFELRDLCEIEPTIVDLTETCRTEYGWPSRYLVLTELLGDSVLVLDAELDQVLNVDFEGGDEAMLDGELPPSWPSFAAFLEWYFG